MASALMRRSAFTALLAAVATIASPWATSAFAATTPLGAPTNVAPSGADKETRPTVTFTYAAPLDETQSTITVVDTSHANAAVPCALSFSPDGKTINCAVSQDLTDKDGYTATANVVNATDSTDKRSDPTSWTTDIPSEVKQSPANGTTNKSITMISVTFDEPISTDSSKVIVDIVNSAGHHVQQSGHTSGSDGTPVPPISGVPVAGTATWTSDVGGLAPSTYTATFRVFATTSPFNPALNPEPAVANDWGTATVTFTVDQSLPADAPQDVEGPNVPAGSPAITQANESAVPFTGFAPVGSNVAVAIYDNFFDTHEPPPPFGSNDAPGTGANDGLGTAVTPSCSDSVARTSLNDVRLCPFSLTVDMSGKPDTGDLDVATDGQKAPSGVVYQWYAYTYTSAGQKPGNACPSTSTDCPVADATIDKDTTGPSTPGGGDAHWNASDNTVTVENATDTNTDGSFDHYVVQIVDPEGNIVTALPTNGTTAGLPMHAFNKDVSPLLDGPLTVNIYSADQWGNLSGADPASTTQQTDPNADDFTLIKESTQTAPSVDTTKDTLTSGGMTYHFTCASNSTGCIPLTPTTRANTPTSVTVYFNEPIKLTQTNTAGNNNKTIRSQICLDDHTGGGSCLNAKSGTTSLTSDSRGLIWTAPDGFSLPTDNYSVSAFAISKYNCPDENNNNVANYPGCDTSLPASQDPVSNSGFVVDDTPPTVTITSVPSLIDANNIKAVTIGGHTDGDTTNVTLTVKSSGGGSARVISINTTPTADGSGTIDWSTTQDLSGLPDGTLSLTATGVDGAGNRTAAANAATASSAMHARPSAPQGLTTAAGNGTIVAVWSAPASNGGSALTGYTLTLTDTTFGGSPMTFNPDPSATTYTVNNLANGHTYTVALTASNNIGSGPAATTSATPRGSTTLTTHAPSVTTYGTPVTVKGALTYAGIGLGGKPITVTSKYSNGAHGPTWHVTTDSNGNWNIFNVKAPKNITFLASYAGETAYQPSSSSARMLVRVAIAITKVTSRNSSHLTAVTILGKVGPNMHGRTVYIYEKVGRHNVKLGTARLTSKSTFSFVHKFARGKHVVFAKFNTQNGNQGNTSRTVKFSRT